METWEKRQASDSVWAHLLIDGNMILGFVYEEKDPLVLYRGVRSLTGTMRCFTSLGAAKDWVDGTWMNSKSTVGTQSTVPVKNSASVYCSRDSPAPKAIQIGKNTVQVCSTCKKEIL